MIKPLFAEPIYHVMDVISEEENQKILDECQRLRDGGESGNKHWDCDIFTSFGVSDSLTFNPVFDNLHETIKKHVDEFKVKTGGWYDTSYAYSWFNISGPGQYQEQHTHPGFWVSTVYYVRSPEGSAGIKFVAPFDSHLGSMFDDTSPYNKQHTVQPIERSLLIFPSYLAHSVPQGRNMEDRISIATNWDNGKEK